MSQISKLKQKQYESRRKSYITQKLSEIRNYHLEEQYQLKQHNHSYRFQYSDSQSTCHTDIGDSKKGMQVIKEIFLQHQNCSESVCFGEEEQYKRIENIFSCEYESIIRSDVVEFVIGVLDEVYKNMQQQQVEPIEGSDSQQKVQLPSNIYQVSCLSVYSFLQFPPPPSVLPYLLKILSFNFSSLNPLVLLILTQMSTQYPQTLLQIPDSQISCLLHSLMETIRPKNAIGFWHTGSSLEQSAELSLFESNVEYDMLKILILGIKIETLEMEVNLGLIQIMMEAKLREISIICYDRVMIQGKDEDIKDGLKQYWFKLQQQKMLDEMIDQGEQREFDNSPLF